MTAQRGAAVRAWMTAEGLDALLVSSAANVRYLTGFSGEGLLVLDGGMLICTDSRYRVQAAEEAPEAECAAEGGHLEQAIERLRALAVARTEGPARVGFCGRQLTWADHHRLSAEVPGIELVPVEDEVARLRAIKDEGEVELVARAARIADAAFVAWRAELQAGISEREAALELERLMVRGGADGASFEVIVAAGPNGAKPHARPSRRAIAEGDLVVVDWGATVEGYCSDCTRTILVGAVEERAVELWRAVRGAQLAALAAIAPGVPGREVDAVARAYLSDRGWEREFGHGLGHGVGLEVHERPNLSRQSEDVLAAGMVVTVEPGVYIDGWGGVRLEELALVTDAGAQVLTSAPYDRV